MSILKGLRVSGAIAMTFVARDGRSAKTRSPGRFRRVPARPAATSDKATSMVSAIGVGGGDGEGHESLKSQARRRMGQGIRLLWQKHIGRRQSPLM